jgi:hypothetical protein
MSPFLLTTDVERFLLELADLEFSALAENARSLACDISYKLVACVNESSGFATRA